jgi:hypothetical protein
MDKRKDDHKGEKKKKGVKPKTFIERYVRKQAVKPLAWVVAYGVASGTIADLLHLPKDDRSIPLTLAPGLKLASGTASTGSTLSTISSLP